MTGTVPGALHAVIDWIIFQQIFTPLPLEAVSFLHPMMAGLIT